MNTKTLLRHAQFHGAKRLIEPKLKHRLCWIFALAIMLWFALGNLSWMIIRFLGAPTYLVTRDTFAATINFPSVLVCPEVYYPDYKIESLLKNAKYPEGITADTIRPIIKQLTAFYSPDAPYTVRELNLVQKFLEYNHLDVDDAASMLTSTCEEILLRCRFYKEDYDCTKIFHMETTLYGFCCTFNGISIKSEQKLKSRSRNFQVWRINEVGPFAALVVAVNQSQYMDHVDLTYKWLVVQSHRRYVDGTNNGTALSPGKETWLSFHLQFFHITDDTLFLGEQLRGCFAGSRKLKHFPLYYKKTCLLECMAENMIRRCHCLLPVHYIAAGVPQCRAQSLPCARKSIEQFNSGKCDCPLNCDNELETIETETYELSTAATPFDSIYYRLNLSGVTVVRVFVKSHRTKALYRSSYFTSFDLFSQLGGVFNVFFGCSILSILELLQLGWHSCQERFKSRTNRMKPDSKKKGKKTSSRLLGICCRSRKRKVKKRVIKTMVNFQNYQMYEV